MKERDSSCKCILIIRKYLQFVLLDHNLDSDSNYSHVSFISFFLRDISAVIFLFSIINDHNDFFSFLQHDKIMLEEILFLLSSHLTRPFQRNKTHINKEQGYLIPLPIQY